MWLRQTSRCSRQSPYLVSGPRLHSQYWRSREPKTIHRFRSADDNNKRGAPATRTNSRRARAILEMQNAGRETRTKQRADHEVLRADSSKVLARVNRNRTKKRLPMSDDPYHQDPALWDRLPRFSLARPDNSQPKHCFMCNSHPQVTSLQLKIQA